MKEKGSNYFSMLPSLKRFDLFGMAPPNLNIRGETVVKTYPGAVFTFLVVILTFLFGLIKLENMATGKNPNLTTNKSQLEPEETFNTNSDDFMMAFAVQSKDGTPKNDPRYIRWYARLRNVTDGIK